MAWREKKGGATIPWDKPQVREGIYRGAALKTTSLGEARLHTLLENGNQQTFWGTAILDNRLGPEDIGKRVRIEYSGQMITTKGGRQAKEFRVYVDDASGDDAGGNGETPE